MCCQTSFLRKSASSFTKRLFGGLLLPEYKSQADEKVCQDEDDPGGTDAQCLPEDMRL